MTTATTADPLPGFIESTFSPLVNAVAHRCLVERPGDGARTAVVLGSVVGDSTTTDLASTLMVGGQVGNPLLFMQATPNAVLGYLSKEFGITGPLVALSATSDLGSALLDAAAVLLDDPELDRVLVVGVELAGNDRTTAALRELDAPPPAEDFAVALVVDRDTPPAEPGGHDLRQLATHDKGSTP
ncbi:beta-ketoacyl synthase N-terminal-like domain-containing protein [Umezawaea sp. Da 62-37]|uniref:beta-ketoacyl synthase N-terminal-like domain-containing protein n=1 Tax=Umezawaea sp. Da 62-37 TaxID=3075927 RepID=UPI0028F70428|nr:beta-ketoacyl synthase N-terminal-like domain-containing protein [Umezawaea sp. Da 62-37]WNV88096.1 beta-ketoacyl synthase N-terminal-like domain-containing protein [Umezawaea sp. Da 62-37]